MSDLASVYDEAAQGVPEWVAWSDLRRCYTQIDALFDDALTAIPVAEDFTVGATVPPPPGCWSLRPRNARMG